MRVWGVVLLLNLALAVGLGTGYAVWGRQAHRLAVELAAAQADGPREYHGIGVVRAILADANLVVISHGAIPGYMPAMTMAFPAASPGILTVASVGDRVRFTLRGAPPNSVLVLLEKTAP